MMRQLVFLFSFIFLLPITSQAQKQREIIPVNWNEVRKVADKDPQQIKNLVAKLSSKETDNTMTLNERILAYYGQTFLTPNTEINEGIDLDKLLNEKKYEECLAGAKELLKKNPVSLKALSNATFAITLMLRDSTKHYNVTREEGRLYFSRMDRIFDIIAATGDGTEKHPFYVTAVSDEYLFLRYYLNIWQIGKQYIAGSCDVLELKETSEYYKNPQIYYEITRVLEMEKDLFKQ